MFYKDALNIPNLIGMFDQKVPGHFETDEFVFFWAGPFSNWHDADFVWTVDGEKIHFMCSEQAMMYAKAKLFGDEVSAKKILKTKKPAEQKRLGRAVTGYVESEWFEVRDHITDEFLLRKFYQNEEFRTILDATGDKEIVEASPYDGVWGIGMGVNHPDILDRTKWQGTNLLGKSLMRVREELRKYGRVHPELEMEAILTAEIIEEIDQEILEQMYAYASQEDK